MFLRQVTGTFRPVALQSIRHLKRKPAYPYYKAELVPLSHPKKDHSGFFPRHLKRWLGPKNLRGEYYRNKYYFPPQEHKPNYIVSDGRPLVISGLEQYLRGEEGRDPSVHPFPQNTNCKTNKLVLDEMKLKIYTEHVELKISTHELALKYGLKVARIEAIVRLQEIEKSWREKVCDFSFF